MTKTVWSGKDLGRLNTIKQVQQIENYRGYNKCLVLTPNVNPYFHCGYLDDAFFAFTSSANAAFLETPQQVVDYYLQINPIFRNSTLEWNIYSKDYKLFINSVKVAYESSKSNNKSCQ